MASRTSAPLHIQHLVPAPASIKIRLALLATALCDALGAPAEFKPRFSFISAMKPNRNFSLGAGVWTDDTSMMLALARSLGTYSGSSSQQAEGTRGGFDEADQLEAYLRWYQDGVLSAIGRCFDIGSTIRRALGIYKDALKASGALSPAETRRLLPAAKEKEKEKRRTTAKSALARIARDLCGHGFSRNGSLMRVLPVGLAYSRDPAGAAAYARRSSATTHPNAVCKAACAAWTMCIARLVRSADAREEAKGEEQIQLFSKKYTSLIARWGFRFVDHGLAVSLLLSPFVSVPLHTLVTSPANAPSSLDASRCFTLPWRAETSKTSLLTPRKQ
ncbi:ADP-ribosylglycohydrolase-domain-containing protein [Mycena alexandri]|uniref:ADP-ribosylglycohydrolase-domain-containing protein n=1 Tax=Mycena alexandri TaxID=1745969 RepID=A0AAD6TH72_9AGAR|nr:ADP-ribosylglycohydrolase-domain-containing protein [Mycena alexandri]